MSDKMKSGQTYQRMPSRKRETVMVDGSSGNGKVQGRGRSAPETVNNSAQGRTAPKRSR
jgi:hypothetical protein